MPEGGFVCVLFVRLIVCLFVCLFILSENVKIMMMKGDWAKKENGCCPFRSGNLFAEAGMGAWDRQMMMTAERRGCTV